MAPLIYLIFHSESTLNKMIPHRVICSFIKDETVPPIFTTKPLHRYPREPINVTLEGETNMHIIIWEHEDHGMIELKDYASTHKQAEEKMTEMVRNFPANIDAKGNMIERPEWTHSVDLDLKQVSLKVGRAWHYWEIEEFEFAQDKGQTPFDASKGWYGTK